MAELTFQIDNRAEAVDIAEKNLLGVLMASKLPDTPDEQTCIREALANPIGSPKLREIVQPGEKIVIVTSDITRPMPTYKVMPQVLDELYAAGVSPKNITLVFALGSHRGHTEEEKRHLAGDRAYEEIACVDLNTDDCIDCGSTSRGTPVFIDRRVAEADRRICLGNIEYHYFAGYSGGAKAIMPGVAARDSIQANHKYMIRPEACAGRIAGNPVREDIEEAASKVGVDFILNVVLNSKKEIVFAVAGNVTEAHRAGCAFLDRLYKKPIPERADIVLVSQGGAPKDMNLYQTQKALDNAKHAVKKGGTIILIGSCKEGFGEKTFEKWITEASAPEELVARIRKEFVLGGHKAAAIAMVMENAEIWLVSDLKDETVETAFMKPYHSVREAYEAALKKHGPDATVWAMPFGGSTLPVPQEQ